MDARWVEEIHLAQNKIPVVGYRSKINFIHGDSVMSVAEKIVKLMEASSWIRKMFEEGAQLKAQYGAENVFDFSLGNPNVDPPDSFYTVLGEAVKERGIAAHGYMPNAGYPSTRAAVL